MTAGRPRRAASLGPYTWTLTEEGGRRRSATGKALTKEQARRDGREKLKEWGVSTALFEVRDMFGAVTRA